MALIDFVDVLRSADGVVEAGQVVPVIVVRELIVARLEAKGWSVLVVE